MRAVLQRVLSASVIVDGVVVGTIKKGVVALIGLADGDTAGDVAWLQRKILNCRLFDNPVDGKRWASSLRSLSLEILLISQFTLHANTKRAKPDFHSSMPGPAASVLFESLVRDMRATHGPARVQTGVFGAMMKVSLENDGPVTIILDSWSRDECGGPGRTIPAGRDDVEEEVIHQPAATPPSCMAVSPQVRAAAGGGSLAVESSKDGASSVDAAVVRCSDAPAMPHESKHV